LDHRNDRSRFHRALHISYPNRADQMRAARRAESPGGLIMIHGQPNGAAARAGAREADWTEGCIAVSNAEIEDIWSRTVDGTPIEILP
jgi:murein L,D-transpeptidase YafK